MPPKLFLQILIHLCSSGVDRIKSIMGLFQNHFFQFRICWYTKASFVPQNSFFILGESGYFACTDTTIDSIDTSICFLRLLNLTDQSGLKFYASQKSFTYQFYSKIFHLFVQTWLLLQNHAVQAERQSAKGIGYYVAFSRVIVNVQVVILD